MTIVGFVTLCLALRFLPALIVEVVATALAVASMRWSRQTLRALIASRTSIRGTEAAWEQRPTAAERRMLARSLDAAVDHCVVMSLLPNIMIRAHRIFDIGRAWGR